MIQTREVLLGTLAVGTVAYLISWYRLARDPVRAERRPADDRGGPTVNGVWIGALTNFFDTLGIGSFAPTTALFRIFREVPDERIPGTMNVGHTPPTILQAFFFIALVQVEPLTIGWLIAASVVGAWIGAGVVASWPRRTIQIGMGVALIIAATVFVANNLGFSTVGGTATGLGGGMLLLAIAGNFVLGALMTLGIGMYAPCMILVGLLGMNALVAFPIMMGSCAFLMPVASARFIDKHAYAYRPSLGLAIGGLPGVLIAAYIVTSLDIYYVRWLVVGVVLIAATMMLRSAARGE
jgi:uncharacterized membrane protein YfcA